MHCICILKQISVLFKWLSFKVIVINIYYLCLMKHINLRADHALMCSNVFPYKLLNFLRIAFIVRIIFFSSCSFRYQYMSRISLHDFLHILKCWIFRTYKTLNSYSTDEWLTVHMYINYEQGTCIATIGCGKKTRGPWATSLTWEKEFKSINTYDYIIMLIKRRKKPLFTLWEIHGFFIWTNLTPLHPGMHCAKFGWN